MCAAHWFGTVTQKAVQPSLSSPSVSSSLLKALVPVCTHAPSHPHEPWRPLACFLPWCVALWQWKRSRRPVCLRLPPGVFPRRGTRWRLSGPHSLVTGCARGGQARLCPFSSESCLLLWTSVHRLWEAHVSDTEKGGCRVTWGLCSPP